MIFFSYLFDYLTEKAVRLSSYAPHFPFMYLLGRIVTT